MIKTSKEALASHLNMDYSELAYYNYQPGRFTRAVYAINDTYYCASKDGRLPKGTRNNMPPFKWVEVPSYVNSDGYKIYKMQREY